MLERHAREQHGYDQGTVTCSYCGRQVRERALNDHCKSRKCRSTRDAMKSSSNAKTKMANANTNDAEFPVGYSIPSLHDAMLACLELHAMVVDVYHAASSLMPPTGYPRTSSAVFTSHEHVLQEVVQKLWQIRGIAFRLMYRGLKGVGDSDQVGDYKQDTNIILICMLSAADDIIFGGKSAHTSYLESHRPTFRDGIKRSVILRL